ncbi:hypothetical protein PHMEG_00022691 [Phytophthora megakarya]|uniref:Uncharacterized protein n=1 Tax=Phytophthora megakarya TaxID=4795 RepID=A0A225VIV2_9STRA|nr:hypothetical protein PHMEG_00022691 [Phytophthora megakarya]
MPVHTDHIVSSAPLSSGFGIRKYFGRASQSPPSSGSVESPADQKAPKAAPVSPVLEVQLLQKQQQMQGSAVFGSCAFILTKQELQIDTRLINDIQTKLWPLESDPVALSEDEDDRFSSDGDISSSDDENQLLHDDAGWGHDAALESFTLRSPASSSVPSVAEEAPKFDGKDEEDEWSIPSPPRYTSRHLQERTPQRSRNLSSPPVSGGAGPLVPVPMIPSSSEGIPPPNRADLVPRSKDRIRSEHRHSQRSFSTTPVSPVISQASSSASRKSKLRTKQRSSSSINSNGRRDRQRIDNHWQDTTSNESRSPPAPSCSMLRRNNIKRLRGNKSASSRRRSSAQDVQDKIKAKPAKTPSFLSLAASTLAVPVAAATLCILTTMATLAIYEMRKTPRN